MKMPRDIGPIHFVGIGGIGMSGIAEVLNNQGYRVRGSDVADSANVQRLRDHGIEVAGRPRRRKSRRRGCRRRLLGDQRDNPELVAARARGLPVVRRAEMLAELMRLKSAIAIGGTHGKTTTTSMVAALLDAGGLDPTVINGGIINAYGTNARMGAGDWMVVEADESDGTFVKLPADIAIVTNIDPEHLDHYGSFDERPRSVPGLRRERPVLRLRGHVPRPPRGPGARSRASRTAASSPMAATRRRRSASSTSSFRGGRSHFSVEAPRSCRPARSRRSTTCVCRCPASTMSRTPPPPSRWRATLGIDADAIRKGLASFGGVKRRFTRTGTWNGVDIYDDYGHHPVEIAAVLQGRARRHRAAASSPSCSRTATRGCRTCSPNSAPASTTPNTVIVADVYPAGRAADRRRRPRCARRGPSRRRPSRRAAAGKRGRAAAARRLDRQARRHGRLPRRRLDHPLGERACRKLSPLLLRQGAA